MTRNVFDKRGSANTQRGFTIVEVLLAISIFVLFLVAVAAYYKKILDVSKDTTYHIQAGFLIEEGFEAMKLLRDTSWSANIAPLAAGTKYYLDWNGSTWTTTTVPQKIEYVFTRSIEASDVYRDGSDNIAASPGTLDAGTKKVKVSVSWTSKGGRATTTDTAETYIMNFTGN